MAYYRKKTRKMTRQTIDFILVWCEILRREEKALKNGKKIDEDFDGGHKNKTMLMGIYNVLINEGYSKKYLDNYFFFGDKENKHKERTIKACKFYHSWFINREDDLSKVDKFFYEDPQGIKIREEINRLTG